MLSRQCGEERTPSEVAPAALVANGHGIPGSPRRLPPLWTIEENNDACFIVKDATGQALGYVYFERSPLSRQLRRARGAAAPRSIGLGRTQQMPNSRHLSEMFR
jgi:hypothetical protein